MNTKLDLIKSGIWGVCVGDALGLPVQFKPRSYMTQNPITNMIGFGTYNQPPGSWSDIGNSTSSSVKRLLSGTSPLQSGDANMEANGNGSLMRTLPLAYLFHFQNTPEDKKFQITKEVSAITHAHPLSVVSCSIYIDFVLQILEGNSIQNSFQKIVADKNKYYQLLTKSEQTYFENILEKDLKNFTESEIKSSGFVIDSLEASFWCLLNSSTYKETVIKAVNLGEDTDTIAAIAGGVAGIFYGYDTIPDSWIQVIANGSEINRVCKLFAKSF